MTDLPAKPSDRSHDSRVRSWRVGVLEFFKGYFWIVFKNVIGWILIILSVPAGLALPGPGGIPMFLIGFALVTFPGKRRLTSRVMRGRGLPIEMEVFTFLTALLAIIATTVLMWMLADWVNAGLQKLHLDPRQKDATYAAVLAGLLVAGLFALGVTWLVMRLALHVLNYILRGMPILRRKLRPWMRKKGLRLLPSRRKKGASTDGAQQPSEQDILHIDERHHRRARVAGAALLLWAKRAIGVSMTLAIFYFIFKPIHENWPDIRLRARDLSPLWFVTAACMLAVFLFAFRVLTWRRILTAFGHTLPVAPAVRIWSTSEMARYLPGAVWHIIGRVYLIRPYGVTASVSTVTQILEQSIFLVANLIVAVACLGYHGFKHLDGRGWWWLAVSAALMPFLLAMLHTRVFYGLANSLLARFGKPRITQRVHGSALPGMLAWNIFGLIWQALALFVLMHDPLGLKIDWLWMLAGAYCLAWCAGFLAIWAPAGLGVRELVFIGVMRMIAPDSVRNTAGFDALLAFLSVMMRLWATAGEIILSSIGYTLDLRGALGRADAPGRVVGIDSGRTNDVDAVV